MADGAELMTAAWQAIQSGHVGEAEQLCRRALQADPGNADGWFLLGAACHCQGRPGEAAEFYTRALRLRPDLPEAHNNLGSALRTLGRPADAVECFRQALRLKADYAEAHHNLGVALRDQCRPDEAETCFRQALVLKPDYPEALNNLGNALLDQGRLAEAEASYRQALCLRPELPEALVNLGGALRGQGRLAEAAECYTRTLRLRPDLPEAHNNLGSVLHDQCQPRDAEGYFRQALRLRPNYPEALNNLGSALREQGRLTEAEGCLRQALELRPELPEILVNLGVTLRDQGRTGEAEACLRRALALRPEYAEALNHLGVVLRNLVGRPGEAAEYYARALQFKPDFPETLNNLAIALRDLGRLDEAMGCFRRALELRPDYAMAHSGLLQTLHYRAGVTPEEMSAAHAEYQARHAMPLRAAWRPHGNDRDPERPLRLGLVSPDLGRHPVGQMLVRAVEALARRPGTVICYSGRVVPADDLTARFKAAASAWHNVAGLDDERMAELIRADGVDVLMDLTGHTGGDRLLTFARRPAPVQATWLGYEGTIGLEAVGYLVADGRLVPTGADVHYRERVLRLPGGYACYDPPAGAPEPGPPPALAAGRVTFGCFNNPAKLSAPALDTFAAVLRRVPEARLVLKYRGLDDSAVAGWLRQHFAAAGVGPDRLELRGASRHAEYLAAYREIDVALDPFPFGGGVTTCDALWMGVPVVTLPGDTFASRHGLSHLSSVGLAGELTARDADDYVALAAGLVHDGGRLSALRAGLRERVARSPLCDGERLADELLAALRRAWQEWTVGGADR